MATSNPYSPPKSEVGDITAEAEAFQEIKLWSAQGRIGRLRYLAYSAAAGLVYGLFVVLATAILGKTVGPAVSILGYLPLLVFIFLAAIKRSHDMNWTGWSVLLTIIPFVGLIWVFKAGTVSTNDYGDPPPPNTRAVKILAFIFPLIAIIGILAAIALPAYKQYVDRARAAQHQTP